MSERVGIALLRVLLFPFYLVLRGIEEISGEGRWYRQQVRRMASDRPSLPDAEFLRAVPAGPGDESLWLAVRRAVADSVGLPAEAVHPQDRLADLWRMQWLGPDLLDLVFRLERQLSVKIPRRSVVKYTGRVRYGQVGEFAEFAGAVVRGLREVVGKAGAERAAAGRPRG
jgi:hypothetical protein